MALNNVPLNGQTLAYTKPLIAGNFSTIDTAFSVDHVSYNTVGAGKHNKVTFPEQAVDPVTGANEAAVYSKDVAGVTQLFFRGESNATPVNFTGATKAVIGETTFPSGIKVKWGASTTNGSGLATINFATAFTTIYMVCPTIATVGGAPNPNGNDRVVQCYNYTNALFSVVTYKPDTARTRMASDFTWFAIGV